MADSKVSTLTAASTLDGTELYYGVQSAADVKVTGTQIKTLVLTGPDTITEAVGSSALTLTGATQTASFPALNITQTWNNSGVTFTGINASITATASAALSRIMSLSVGGSELAGVVKDGAIFANLGIWKSAAASFNGSNYHGFAFQSSGIDCYAPAFSATATALRIGSAMPNGVGFGVAVGGPLGLSDGNASTLPDVVLSRGGAATLQQGDTDAAAPVAQTLQAQSVVAGTTDTAGTDWTLRNSLGTGTGASGNFITKAGFSAKSTGTSQHATVDRNIVVAKGKVLTSAAAFSMFDVSLPTLSMCGGVIEATIVCSNGTDMQSFTQTVTYSAVNKGGVYTTSITPSTGDKSVSTGTLTTSWTIVSGTNKVTIKVTPTTSLTPSTNAFLLYYTVRNNSEQATTIL